MKPVVQIATPSIIDFDSKGLRAYHFQVTNGDSIRDGIWSNENQFSDEWDGDWQVTTRSYDDRWEAEYFIPWDVVPLRKISSDTRVINVLFNREVRARQQVLSYPEALQRRARFISSFAPIEIDNFAEVTKLELLPYVSSNFDLLENNSEENAGIDLYWQPALGRKLSVSVNPDFGQVESDDLVVNFSAIETFFSEKRPFFLENQALFNLRGNEGLRLVNTRRIGAASSCNCQEMSDIDGAIKYTETLESLDYGFFAAFEDDTSASLGRDFYVGRAVYSGDNWRLGYLATYTDDEQIDRTATVSAIDFESEWDETVRLSGQLLYSDINAAVPHEDGVGAWFKAQVTSLPDWNHQFLLTHYDQNLQINDLGFLPRNNLNKIEYQVNYTDADFSDNQISQNRRLTGLLEFSANNNGDRLSDKVEVTWLETFRSTAEFETTLLYRTDGIDDLISRGNGNVDLPERWAAEVFYSTPKNRGYVVELFTQFFTSGLKGNGTFSFIKPTFFINENLTMEVYLSYLQQDSFLIWLTGDQFGEFNRSQPELDISGSYSFLDKHELRLKLQWVGLEADRGESLTLVNEQLIGNNLPEESFSLSQFGVQLRYRYSIDARSDFFAVYSRGANSIFTDPQDPLREIFQDDINNPDDENFFIKIRYSF